MENLIEEIRNGNSEAIKTAYRDNSKDVCEFAKTITGDDARAKEATKKAFVKLFSKIRNGYEPASIRIEALKLAHDEACRIMLPSSELIDSPFDKEPENEVAAAAPEPITPEQCEQIIDKKNARAASGSQDKAGSADISPERDVTLAQAGSLNDETSDAGLGNTVIIPREKILSAYEESLKDTAPEQNTASEDFAQIRSSGEAQSGPQNDIKENAESEIKEDIGVFDDNVKFESELIEAKAKAELENQDNKADGAQDETGSESIFKAQNIDLQADAEGGNAAQAAEDAAQEVPDTGDIFKVKYPEDDYADVDYPENEAAESELGEDNNTEAESAEKRSRVSNETKTLVSGEFDEDEEYGSHSGEYIDEEYEDDDYEGKGRFRVLFVVLLVICIVLALTLAWFLIGLLENLGIIPDSLDLGYTWFNNNIYPIF